MPTKPSLWGGGYSADTLYFTTEFSGDNELNTGRIYLGGTLMAKPSVWEELTEPEPIHYEMVDLGLSVKWADRNVGAASPEAYGDHFAWGETAPRGENWPEEAPYYWEHTPFNNGLGYFDEEYFSTVSATVCPGRVLAPEYDTAHVIMGDGWRMPTRTEISELVNGTTQSVEELRGVKGMRFTAPNGNSIFMPFAGRGINGMIDDAGIFGGAWTSSLDTETADRSNYHIFYDSGADVNQEERWFGFVVRGVCQ